ncbi:MAG: glycoside hydrolase family 127 protein [Bacteroidota bacterium]
MKNSVPALVVLFLLALYSCSGEPEETTGYPLKSLDLSEVKITGGLWATILQTSRTNTLPHELAFLENTGRLENFSRAAGTSEGPFTGERYNDSDVYKVLEGISYHLIHQPDEKLEHYADSVIRLIAAAQEADGYLYTPWIIHPDADLPGCGKARWQDVLISHELYNAGHLYEAAVAYYKATGKRELLDVAIRNADLVCSVFNTNGIKIAPGHQEIEIGLVKLAQATGEKSYLDQAQFFLDQRGGEMNRKTEPEGTRFEIYNERSYLQYHQPVREQAEAVGHAVRAMYMYSGMTDVGVLEGDTGLLNAVERLWKDMVSKKIYLTGGVGASERGEAFSGPYDLPNATAYCETCAACGNMFWNSRLFNMSSDPRYMDLLEVILYNGFLSGISYDGTRFFYPNPLESDGTVHRSEWFGVACCPTNVLRTVPEVAGFIYSKSDFDFYVNLFVESEAKTTVNNTPVKVSQVTNYPWEGKVLIKVDPEKPVRMKMHIRIPGWINGPFMPGKLYRYKNNDRENVTVRLNGKDYAAQPGRLFEIDRKWKSGDVIELNFPMPVRQVIADENVKEDLHKAALTRGPVVYTFEGLDNGGSLSALRLSPGQEYNAIFDPGLLYGMTVIRAEGLQAIPYFAWDNRSPSPMKVWIPFKE